ncbi:MAG: GNAT family N-acetyltransferase [Bellilinea sp.]
MTFATQLFQSENLVLEAYDLEKDPASEAVFTYDFNYVNGIDYEIIPHPLTAFEVKTKREEQLKKGNETDNFFLFAIRRKIDSQFLGVLSFPSVFWFNRYAYFKLAIGEPEMRQAFYEEALSMALRYGLEELGLYSIYTTLSDDEPEVMAGLQNAGFDIAVRQRENIFRNGKLRDRIFMEIHQDQWKKRVTEAQS